jgi:hypothetical protein
VPFRGNSHYKENFTEDQRKALLQQQAELKKLHQSQKVNKLVLGTYQQQPFNYATTNNEKLKDFKIATQFVND